MATVIRRPEQREMAWALSLDVHRLRKPLVYGTGVMALILFGDVILPMVWHAFILLLEVMEALMDHALEMVFGLDPWTAQLITAWSGFFAAVSVAVLAVRKAKALFRRCRSRLEGWWEEHFTRS